MHPNKIVSKYLLRLFIIFTVIASFFSCKNETENPKIPPGNTDSTAGTHDSLYIKYHLDKIKLPAGFTISVYAVVPYARTLCVSPSGTVFVGTKDKSVYAIPDKNKDGKADSVYEIAKGMNAPNGVAFKDGNLYFATYSTIYKMENVESNLVNPAAPVAIYDQYPSEVGHGLKNIAFGPDGKLYVPVGAPCNVCIPTLPVFGTITRINADGTDFEIYAKGIRNSEGFDWDPVTKQMWFTDNGRDNLGDDIPSDELNMAPNAGMDFGFPYCHQGNIPDPEFGKIKNCSDFTAPQKLLGAHVASLGMRFNKQSKFPAEYNNAIFIAEHGSWNRTVPIGYRIAVVEKDKNGNYGDPKIFAEGWLQNEKEAIGRPVDVQFLNDGSMLVTDDFNGTLYKIKYAP